MVLPDNTADNTEERATIPPSFDEIEKSLGKKTEDKEPILLTPEKREISILLKQVLRLIAIIVLSLAGIILLIAIADFIIEMFGLHNASDLEVFKDRLEVAKSIGELAIERVNGIMQLALGALIGLFVSVLGNFNKN